MADRPTPPGERNVFISHAAEDAEAVQRLRSALQQAGFVAASASESIAPGDNVLAAISQAIRQADVVLVLVSPHSTSSSWVETEAAIAVGHVLSGGAGRVIPVLLGDAEIPFVLRQFHGIRLREAGDVESVVQALASLPPSPQSVTEDLQTTAALQRRALENERAAYEVEREMLELRGRNFYLAGTTIAMALSALGIVIAMLSGRPVALLGTALAPLTLVIGFLVGRRVAATERLGERE